MSIKVLEELKQIDALIWVALITDGTDIDADFQSEPANFLFVAFKVPVHQTFKMVADANHNGMLDGSD